MQQCKRILNGEPLEERVGPEHVPVQAVTVRVAPDEQQQDGAEGSDGGAAQPAAEEGEVPDDAVQARTTSTNASDDYSHRGDALATMPLYVYRMYVRRAPRPGPAKMECGTLVCFEPHYAC